ncbi:DUF308 domain-containing protein [Saccharothrix isguenensis]
MGLIYTGLGVFTVVNSLVASIDLWPLALMGVLFLLGGVHGFVACVQARRAGVRWLELIESGALRLAAEERVRAQREQADRARRSAVEELDRARHGQGGPKHLLRSRYRPDLTERLDRVQRMLAAGSFISATRELEDWRANTADSAEIVEIHRLLDQVERARAEAATGRGRAKRRWRRR